MQTRRYLVVANLLLISLLLCGCGKKPAQTATALNSNNPTATSQSGSDSAMANRPAAGNSATQDSGAANAAPSSTANNPASGANAGNTPPATASNAEPATVQPAPALVIPAGTPITVRLQERLSSASAVPGERFEATIDQPIVVGDRIVVPVGALATGHVVVARRSGRLRHPGELGLTLDSVTVGQQTIRLATSSFTARGASHKKRNFAWIGGGSGGGALIGALAAGGKGALIGGGIGAAAGTTTALITGKKDVVFGSERRLRFRLNQEVSVSG